MSNIYRLIIFLPLFMLGCVPNVIDENKVTQKIESLDMTIFSKSGDKIYSITSPKSIYDKINLRILLLSDNVDSSELIIYLVSSPLKIFMIGFFNSNFNSILS